MQLSVVYISISVSVCQFILSLPYRSLSYSTFLSRVLVYFDNIGLLFVYSSRQCCFTGSAGAYDDYTFQNYTLLIRLPSQSTSSLGHVQLGRLN